MKERLNYIDIAKGILILLVVYDHLPDVYLLKFQNSILYELNSWQWVYKVFFMPAFFAITGMCSNFEKPFISFAYNNFKSLIVPNILVGILLSPYNLIGKLGGAFLHGGTFWFLSALYVAKIIYWILYKYLYDKTVWRFLLLLLLTFIGFGLNMMPAKYDIWYFHYAFSLIIFFEIGRFIKLYINKSYVYISLIVYVTICLYLFFWGGHKPVVAMGTNCKMSEIPLYILSATSGTILLLWLSMLLSKNIILEFFGKESLVFYVFQIFVLTIIENVYIRFFPVSNCFSVCMFVFIVFISTILSLTVISYIVETKYFRFILGRF